MSLTLRSTAFVLALSSFPAVFGQISFGGRAVGLLEHGPWLPEAPVSRMPEVDVATLLAEDAARAAQGIKGPFRFGFNHTVDLGTGNSGIWHTLRNGDRVWRIVLECPGANSINFVFDTYVVPEGGRVFVYNAAAEQLGAFTAGSNPGHTSLGVAPLWGERITVEYHEPAAVSGQGELRIGQVTHAYRDIFKRERDFGDSGDCNINVICPEGDDWRDEIRSVMRIIVGGQGFCTGTLINNCEQDSTPYVLTANHCLNDQIANSVFLFNWESPTCDPTEDAPMDQTMSGCLLLVNSGATDVALLQLTAIPPEEYNVWYAGWDHGATPATSVVGIHHPAGDIKKMSRSDGAVVAGTFDGADCWNVQVWNAGTTEPGSSGSGLWNQDHRLVGQLFGGAADCTNSVDDYYGRLDISWPLLETYLGTCADTLNGWEPGMIVVQPDTNDAAVTSILNIPELLCNDSIVAPLITLKNNGTDTLTSVMLTYGVQFGTPSTVEWTGELRPDQTANYQLPAIIVPSGDQVLTVTSSLPNGETDQILENDSWTFAFVVSSPGEEVSLLLTPDNFGSDITWSLATEMGTVLYEGGPYADLHAGETDTIPFCLTDACYVFTIHDQFGDGICCEEGEGNYLIQDGHGTIYTESNGDFTYQEVREFCVTVVGLAEQGRPLVMSAFPNPAKDLLTVQLGASAGPASLLLTDATGREVLQRTVVAAGAPITLDLASLANGLYVLSAQHADGRAVQRIVVRR